MIKYKFPLKIFFKFYSLYLIFFLTGCGFYPQGEMTLAPPLKLMYLESQDPYGALVNNLQAFLKMSHVKLTTRKTEAETTLIILQDHITQELLSVSGTTQTRQYNLKINVMFEIRDTFNNIVIGPQMLTEMQTITIQSNQILGSSNEASLFYQQMYRRLAYAIMNRISSKDITHLVNLHFQRDSKV